jgi:hypothetical protein
MQNLSDLLRAHFGEDFPVGNGSAKRDDPPVILDGRVHVSIEYAVAQLLLGAGGYEYELEQQQTHHNDGRVIDELVYATRPKGASDWTGTGRFFFDVTHGFTR